MTAMFQVFVDIISLLWTFVQTYLIPATTSDINIIHVAIWTPVAIGILNQVVNFGKGMWRSGKRA